MATGITSPESGSTLRGSIEIFTWDLDGIMVESSFVYVGSTSGNLQHGSRNVTGASRASFGGLPTDGSTVFVRLWYRSDGVWRFFDEEYRAAAASNLPAFVDPEPGGSLDGPIHTVAWNYGAMPVDDTWLYVGAIVGGSDYAVIPTGAETSVAVSGLPTDGSTVHARLYFRVGGGWYNVDGAFDAALAVPPSRDELTRELQGLVGATPDGDVGPMTRAALNRNWLGRPDSFDPSFAVRFANDAELVRWVQRRINTRTRGSSELTGIFDATTESAVVAHLGRRGVVAAESFLTLLDP